MERTTHFSDISEQMITDPGQLAQMTVLEHPEIDEPVKLEATPEELANLGKLAMEPVICEVTMPGEEEPTRYVFTPANFGKLAGTKPMKQVLADASPAEIPKRRNGNGSGNGDVHDHNTIEWAGTPHKGKTSPHEALLVREHLDEINARLAAAGHRAIDPANPDHVRRYGLLPQTANGPVETAPGS